MVMIKFLARRPHYLAPKWSGVRRAEAGKGMRLPEQRHEAGVQIWASSNRKAASNPSECLRISSESVELGYNWVGTHGYGVVWNMSVSTMP